MEILLPFIMLLAVFVLVFRTSARFKSFVVKLVTFKDSDYNPLRDALEGTLGKLLVVEIGHGRYSAHNMENQLVFEFFRDVDDSAWLRTDNNTLPMADIFERSIRQWQILFGSKRFPPVLINYQAYTMLGYTYDGHVLLIHIQDKDA